MQCPESSDFQYPGKPYQGVGHLLQQHTSQHWHMLWLGSMADPSFSLQITCLTSAAAGYGSPGVTVVVVGVSQAPRCCYTYSTEFNSSKATAPAQVAGSARAECAGHGIELRAVWLEHNISDTQLDWGAPGTNVALQQLICHLSPAALHAACPPAGPAGGTLSLIGWSNWRLDQDCKTVQLTEGSPPSRMGRVMFGAYLCSLGPIEGVDRFAGAWLCTLTGSLPSPKHVFEQNLPSARRLQRTVLDRLLICCMLRPV
jgi:hypothetical protein